MSYPSRLPLSIGGTTASKVGLTLVAAFIAGVSTVMALFALGFATAGRTTVRSSVGGGDFHLENQGNLVPGAAPAGLDPAEAFSAVGLAGVAIAAVVALLAAYLVLRTWRTAAWLDGTTLTVRGPFTTKSADLANARVSGGSRLTQVGAGDARAYTRVQLLQATDLRSGVSVTLPLRSTALAMLPAEQLEALADAITRNRSGTEATDPAFAVAAHLRTFARDPIFN